MISENPKNILLCLLILLVILACDPAKILIIQNSTKKNVDLEIVSNEKDLPDVEGTLVTKYRLAEDGKKSKKFIYGFGGWRQQELDVIKTSIRKVVIYSKSSDTIFGYTNKDTISEMISAETKGFSKNILKLTIEK
ncbi:hypothetical protein [Aquimarina mytili]|uniref:Lipoprotein n=1 Tax=Aquimarina mytili TaxID=874423 RepID=A0A936ZSQ9_9FLAO|nr:hypothetical protein [Aquimarina mytili]MBL0684914.1 hypothetical protein [Aquimarina mytili]